MSLDFLFQGTILGFSIAAPVGPIGVLCMRRTLAEGRIVGLITGLGAATADLFYGFIAGFGLTFVSDILIDHQIWIRLIGGIFLLYLGVKTFVTRPAEKPASIGKTGLIGAYTSALFLTLTNPMTILSFVAVFAGLGLGSVSGSYISAGLLISGVFIGSALWWFFLSSGVSFFREKISSRKLRWINKVSGGIIMTFGLIVLINLR